MTIIATRPKITIVHRRGVHAGRVGLNWPDRVNTRRCRLPGAMAGPASLSQAFSMNRRGWFTRQRHGMDVAVTARAGGKLHTRNALYSLRAMHTYRLLGEHLGMASFTVNRIEPAPVPAFPADVAIEAFRQTVRSALELSQINFVAIVTGVLFLSVGRLQP